MPWSSWSAVCPTAARAEWLRSAGGRRRRQPGLVAQAPGVRATVAPLKRRRASVPYAELHCHSNFSFLDGASHPEELAEEATRLGLEALALTDHDGFYGVVRFAEAAREVGLPTVFGAELTVGRPGPPPAGEPDPAASTWWSLARDPAGYARLARALSRAQMAGEKGAPRITDAELAELARGDHWLVLTGCRKGAVPAALVATGPAAAGHALDRLVAGSARDNVVVELWDHGDPLDSARNDALAELAVRRGVDLVATNNVHYATPARRRLATALAAVRARRSLDEIDGWLPGGARRSPAVRRRAGPAVRPLSRAWCSGRPSSGRSCAFDLALVAPNLPPFPCPPGLDEMAYLRRLAERAPSAAATAPARTHRSDRHCSAGMDPDRPRARRDRARSGSPATSSSCGTSSQFCRRDDISARGGGRRPTARSATPSASPKPMPCGSACCSSGSCRPSATARPTSTSTSRATGAKR